MKTRGRTSKTIAAFLLSFAMLAGLFPVGAFAAEDAPASENVLLSDELSDKVEEAESSPDEETLSEEETWEEPENIEDTAGNQDDAEDLEEELPAGEDDEMEYLTGDADMDPNATKTIVWPSGKAISDPVYPDNTNTPWSGSYVWYGKYNQEPMRYRMLKLYERPDDAIYGPTHDHDNEAFRFSRDRATMFLDSDRTLFDYTLDSSWRTGGWGEGAALVNYLNGEDFLNLDGVFTGHEKDAIIISKESFRGKTYANYTNKSSKYGSLNEKIFMLGYSELIKNPEIPTDNIREDNYGYYFSPGTTNATLIKKNLNGEAANWWLRSRESGESEYINASGKYNRSSTDASYGISPAFNLNAESIVFESLISSESSSGEAGAPGAEYTLTLLDDGLEASVADKTTYDKDTKTVTIPYAVADYSEENDPNAVVAIVTKVRWEGTGWVKGWLDTLYDSNDGTYDCPLQVQKQELTDPVGELTFTLDDRFLNENQEPGDYHIYLFAMDENGAYETDYAGIPDEVYLPQEDIYPPTVAVRPGINTIDLNSIIPSTADRSVEKVEDPDGILAGDPIINTNHFRVLQVNVKDGIIAGKCATISVLVNDNISAPYMVHVTIKMYEALDDGMVLETYLQRGATTSIDLSDYMQAGGKLKFTEALDYSASYPLVLSKNPEISGNKIKVSIKEDANTGEQASLKLTVEYAKGKEPLKINLKVHPADKVVKSLGTEIIHNPQVPADETEYWEGDHVFYGKNLIYWNSNAIGPTKYRVLDTAAMGYNPDDDSAKSMFLECDTAFRFSSLSNYDIHSWPDSAVRNWLNGEGFLTKAGNFTALEKESMVPSTINSHPLTTEGGEVNVPATVKNWNPNYTGLDHDKVFLLDAEDLYNSKYGYGTTSESRTRVREQTTSLGRYVLLRQYGEEYYTCIDNGSYKYNPDNPTYALKQQWTNDNILVSPAFNVDLSSVVLTCENTGGMAGYTFALLDKGLQIKITGSADTYSTADGKTKIEIPYSISDNSSASDPDCVMAVVTKGTWSENGWIGDTEILQCEKLEMAELKAKGKGYLTLNDGIPNDSHIYVFAMDQNPVFETSYVSEPVSIGILADITGFEGDYDGQAHGITVDVKNPVNGAVVKYGLSADTYNLTESPEITNVSDSPLTVYYQITAPDYESVTGSETVIINEATPSLTVAPTAKTGLKYTGTEQVLVNAGFAKGGTLYYAVTDRDAYSAEPDSYKPSLPKALNAGQYYVWYKVVGDENYKNTDPQKIEVEIETGAHDWPQYYMAVPANQGTYQTLTLPELPQGEYYTCDGLNGTDEQKRLIAGDGRPQITGRDLTFTTKSAAAGTAVMVAVQVIAPEVEYYNHVGYLVIVNIMAVDKESVEVSIEGGDRTVEYGTAGVKLEGRVETGGEETGVWTWESSDNTVAEIDDTGEVTIRNAGTTNIKAIYTSDDKTGYTGIRLDVEKKTLDVAWENTNLVFNGTSQRPMADLTGELEGDTVSVMVSGAEADAGTGYVAKATLSGASAKNYVVSEEKETCAFSIRKADLQDAEIALENALTYTGSAQTQNVAVKFGENVVDASNYEITGNTKTDAGTYELTVKAKADGNCIGQVTKKFTIAKKQTTVTATIKSTTYNGSLITPSITVKDANGLLLVYKQDYLYELTNNLNAGNGKLRIYSSKTGNYSFPETEKAFEIRKEYYGKSEFYITRYCESFTDLHDYIDFSEYLPADCGTIDGSCVSGCSMDEQNDNILGYRITPPDSDPDPDSMQCRIYAGMQNYEGSGSVRFYITYYKQSMSLCEKGIHEPVVSKKLISGKSFTLVPKYENITNTNTTWTSSDPDVAKVDQNGKVTAVAAGYALITATGENLSAQCSVVVTDPVTSVTLDQKKYSLGTGEYMVLTATVLPFTAKQDLEWKSNNDIVEIIKNSDGKGARIIGKKTGKATVTVSAKDGSGKKATCSFTVGNPVPATNTAGFTVTGKGNATILEAGKTLAMNVNWPDNKKPANPDVIWTVEKADGETKEASEIATITQKGVLTGLSEGKIKVVATGTAANYMNNSSRKAVSEEITVYVPVKSVALNVNSGTVSLKDPSDGKTLQLFAIVTSAVPGQEATDVAVTWSVDNEYEKYLTVGTTGIVQANRAANNIPVVAKVTAFNGYEKTLTCKVSVKEENPLKDIKISQKKLSIGEGNKAMLSATLDPVNPDVGGYTWSSSDPAVVTVDENGQIVGKKAGKATITATATGTVTVRGEAKHPSASCEVTVTPSVTGIELKNLSVTAANRLAVGKTLSAKTAFLSSDGKNKAKTTLTWTSSNPEVATVSPKGVVKAVAPGTARITAVSTDAKAEGGTAPAVSFDVEVFAPVTKLLIDKSKLTLGTSNGTRHGKVSVSALLPEYATDASIMWTVNNENVSLAAILQDELPKLGVFKAAGESVTTKAGEALAIRALVPGTVKLTGITTDGTKKKVSCTITIRGNVTGLKLQTTETTDRLGQVELVKVGQYRSRLKAGGKMSLKAIVSINGIAGDETDKTRKKLYTDYKKTTEAGVSFRSSRPDVIKVDKNGKITVDRKAAKGQMATIYAVAADGQSVQIRISVVE